MLGILYKPLATKFRVPFEPSHLINLLYITLIYYRLFGLIIVDILIKHFYRL